MSRPRLQQVIGIILLVIVFLAGYGSLVTAESPTPTAPAQAGLLKLIRTVQVTPDDTFKTGSFARINYVPATDRFVVTFGTKASLDAQPGKCQGAGYAYKEYTTDMQETGKTGRIFWMPDACEAGDWGLVMVDNTLYLVKMHGVPGQWSGWRMFKYDAVSWKALAEVDVPLDLPKEKDNDPMVAYVNGQLDLSGQYDASGSPPPLEAGAATHHQFFSTDLKPLGKKILADTPHITGSSMIYVDGIYYFVTANAFMGDLIVMKYDENWKYLGVKELVKTAHWSQGIAFDGERFYVAYLNTSQRTQPGFLPVFLNVRLAAFDRDWNLVDDVAVTNYAPSDNKQPGRPWVIVHQNRLYVSYDLDTVDPARHMELLQWQAEVSVYELTQRPS
jgi:uncharacterized protein YceK